MLNIAVAESPQPAEQAVAVMREIAIWFRTRVASGERARRVLSRRSAVSILVLSIAGVSAAVSPPGPGGFEIYPAGLLQSAQQQRAIDNIWCNHVITVDSQGYTDKVLDCRTMTAWRAAIERTQVGGDVLALAP